MPEKENKSEIQFTTPAEIRQKYYKVSAVVTRLGNAYQIRSIQPGEFVVLTGSPLIAALAEKGIDIQDDKARVQAIRDMSDEEKIDLAKKIAGDSNLTDTAKEIACKGVTSLNLIMKSPEETVGEEVSVDLIPNEDLEEIVAAVMEISSTEEDIKAVYTFQDFGEEETEGSDRDTPDGERIQQEAGGDTVSSGESEC